MNIVCSKTFEQVRYLYNAVITWIFSTYDNAIVRKKWIIDQWIYKNKMKFCSGTK